MRILVDLDETLVNLVDKWVYYYNNKYGTSYTREDLTEYGSIGDEKWIEFLRIPGFHADLPWIDSEAPAILQRLKTEGHRISVASTLAAWESARDKYSWCHTHLRIPGIISSMKRDVYLGGEKQRISADVLIDDNPGNLRDYPGYTIVYDQPWNRKYDRADFRAFSWREVYNILREVEYLRAMEPYVRNW